MFSAGAPNAAHRQSTELRCSTFFPRPTAMAAGKIFFPDGDRQVRRAVATTGGSEAPIQINGRPILPPPRRRRSIPKSSAATLPNPWLPPNHFRSRLRRTAGRKGGRQRRTADGEAGSSVCGGATHLPRRRPSVSSGRRTSSRSTSMEDPASSFQNPSSSLTRNPQIRQQREQQRSPPWRGSDGQRGRITAGRQQDIGGERQQQSTATPSSSSNPTIKDSNRGRWAMAMTYRVGQASMPCPAIHGIT